MYYMRTTTPRQKQPPAAAPLEGWRRVAVDANESDGARRLAMAVVSSAIDPQELVIKNVQHLTDTLDWLSQVHPDLYVDQTAETEAAPDAPAGAEVSVRATLRRLCAAMVPAGLPPREEAARLAQLVGGKSTAGGCRAALDYMGAGGERPLSDHRLLTEAIRSDPFVKATPLARTLGFSKPFVLQAKAFLGVTAWVQEHLWQYMWEGVDGGLTGARCFERWQESRPGWGPSWDTFRKQYGKVRSYYAETEGVTL